MKVEAKVNKILCLHVLRLHTQVSFKESMWFFFVSEFKYMSLRSCKHYILMRIIFEQSIITYIIFFSLCTELSQWLIENKLVEHLFGPNLHVEVI